MVGLLQLDVPFPIKCFEMRSDWGRSAWSDWWTIDCDDSCAFGGDGGEVGSDEYVRQYRPRNGNISGSRIDNTRRTQTQHRNIDVNTFQ